MVANLGKAELYPRKQLAAQQEVELLPSMKEVDKLHAFYKHKHWYPNAVEAIAVVMGTLPSVYKECPLAEAGQRAAWDMSVAQWHLELQAVCTSHGNTTISLDVVARAALLVYPMHVRTGESLRQRKADAAAQHEAMLQQRRKNKGYLATELDVHDVWDVYKPTCACWSDESLLSLGGSDSDNDSDSDSLGSILSSEKASLYLRIKLGYKKHTTTGAIGGTCVSYQGVYVRAHQLLLWLYQGPPSQHAAVDVAAAGPSTSAPPKEVNTTWIVAMHMCANANCLCVKHIFYGTASDNHWRNESTQRYEMHIGGSYEATASRGAMESECTWPATEDDAEIHEHI
jgi:hypothetical protein